jgi:hypothetical protein
MSRTYEHYRDENIDEDMERQPSIEEERLWYLEQLKIQEGEKPSTEEDLFRWIKENEREE